LDHLWEGLASLAGRRRRASRQDRDERRERRADDGDAMHQIPSLVVRLLFDELTCKAYDRFEALTNSLRGVAAPTRGLGQLSLLAGSDALGAPIADRLYRVTFQTPYGTLACAG
jgi:hypothetical protein